MVFIPPGDNNGFEKPTITIRKDGERMEILAFKPYSSHPGDNYLKVVLVLKPDGEYVVWTKNEQDHGYHNGTYCYDLTSALKAFNERGGE